MKILKKVILVLLILIAIPLIAALFMKKEYSVEREITINKANTQVFEYLKYFKNQVNYSTWINKDPKLTIKYIGVDGQVGAISAWDGNSKVGKGEQELKKIDEGKRIDVELRFKEPFEANANAYFTT